MSEKRDPFVGLRPAEPASALRQRVLEAALAAPERDRARWHRMLAWLRLELIWLAAGVLLLAAHVALDSLWSARVAGVAQSRSPAAEQMSADLTDIGVPAAVVAEVRPIPQWSPRELAELAREIL